MRTLLWLGLALALPFTSACQKKSTDGPATPAPRPQAAAPGSMPEPRAHGDMPQPGHPQGGTPGAHAPGGTLGGGQAAGDPVAGTVTLGEGVEPGLTGTDVLFVMARSAQGGGLLAVKKMEGLSKESFPAEFQLGPAESMMMGAPFNGPFTIYARLDRDGDPMTKTDEDLYAEVAAPVDNGATELELVLRPGKPEAAPAPPPGLPSGHPPTGGASSPAGH